MKLLEGVLALCAVCAVPQAGWAHNLETFPEGADPVVLNTQDAQRNVRGKAGSVVSQFVFQGDGVLRPTGSGAVCTVNVTPVATNGTLTIDCTQFAFTAGETKTLHLAGGVYCGTAGVLAVRGAEAVKVGYREAAACPALSIPNVDLGGATLEIVAGVALFALPPKDRQPWSIAPDAWVYVQGDNALAEETVAGVLDWTGRTGELHLGARNPIPRGVTLRMGSKGRVLSYPTAPWLTVSDEAGHVYCDWASRGGVAGCVVDCDIELAAASTLSVQLRNQTFNGTIRGAGTLELAGYRMASTAPTVFNGPVDLSGTVDVAPPNQPDKSAFFVFNDAAFTNGVVLSCMDSATNVTITFNGRVGPRFTRAAFPAWQDNRAGNVHVVLAEGTALHLERVTRGGAVFGGAGMVVAGTVAAADALFQADDGTKVVKDAAVPGPLRAERQAGYTVYRGWSGTLRLVDHPGETLDLLGGDVEVGDGVGATVNVVGDGVVNLTTEGMAWQGDANLLLWVSGDAGNTVSNLYVVEGASVGSDTTRPAEVGYTTNTSYGTYWVSEWMDRRGTGFETCRLVNDRLVTQGTPQFYDTVYLQAKKEAGTGNLYLSSWTDAGNDSSRRLVVRNGRFTSVTAGEIVMVFGSQHGGGAALVSAGNETSANLFGRAKGLQNPILANRTARVWLDGTEVDPTTQTFNGGWQVVSLRPDAACQLQGIGYGVSFLSPLRDGGGQNYAEILVFKEALSDARRKDVERYLARKWRIAAYVDTGTPPQVAVTGSGHVHVAGDVTVEASDFSGTCELHDSAHVSFPAASNVVVSGCGSVSALAQQGVPRAFAPTFKGVLRLDFETLAFDVDTRRTSAVNALHVEPAWLDVDRPMSLAVRQVGHGDQMLIDLVTAGGFLSEPRWELASSEGFAQKPKLDGTDPCAVRLKVPFPGLTVILR